jgi:hypothetical protein
MKYQIMLLSLMFVFTSNAYSNDPVAIPVDNRIKLMMIGSWVPNPKKQKIKTWAITTFQSDGTLKFVQYKSSVCESIMSVTHAGWNVRNGNLVIVVHESTEPSVFPAAMKIIDKVISIDKQQMVLKDNDNVLAYSTKSNKCLKD